MRIFQFSMARGEMKESHAADVWEDESGYLKTSGIWDGIVPVAVEDIKIQAELNGVSSMEWLRRRLMSCSCVRVEMVD